MKIVLWVLSVLLCVSSHAWADETVFIEENGFLTFEAESIPALGEWRSLKQLGGFTGSGYYQWGGPTLLSVSRAGQDTLKYHFRINNPGNYELRWRNRIAIGTSNTEHNDSWVRFATGANIAGEHPLNGWTKVFMNQRNVWSWGSRTVDGVGRSLRQFFSAGDHTIEISGRSTGHAIDRVVLYQYDEHNFSEEAFNTAAASRIIQGSVEIAAPEADVTSQNEQTSVPSQEPPQQSAPTNTNESATLAGSPGSCSSGRAVIAPVADLYVQSGNIIEQGQLRVEHANRTAYLQFDTTGITDGIQTASLQFMVGSDGGSGVLDVYTAGHSEWSEQTTELDSLPSATAIVGSESAQWGSGTVHEITLDTSLLVEESVSLILELQNNSSDFSIQSSDAGENSPRLILTGESADFCLQLTAGVDLEKIAAPDAQAIRTAATGGGSISLWFTGFLLLFRRKRKAGVDCV